MRSRTRRRSGDIAGSGPRPDRGRSGYLGARKLFYEITEFSEGIESLVALGDRARRDGLASLEEFASQKSATQNPFDRLVRMGLALIVDGVDPELTTRVLEHYAESYLSKLQYRWDIWENFIQLLGDSPTPPPAVAREFLEASLLADHPENQLLRTALGDFLDELLDESASTLRVGAWPPAYADHPLAGSSLRLIMLKQGLPGERIKKALANHFRAYKDLFIKMTNIAIEGVISIQSADNPRLMRSLLATLEGHDILQIRPAAGEAGFNLTREELDSLLMSGDEHAPERLLNLSFEDVFLSLDFRAIQRLFKDVDLDDLSRAMAAASIEVRELILANLSVGAVQKLQERTGAASRDEIRRAQQRILDLVHQLREAGEIAVQDPEE